ncbi:hypothetical protein Ahia01_000606000 [Argonauta hians]
MAELVVQSQRVNLSDFFPLAGHILRYDVPLDYIAPVLKTLLDLIVNLRSEGRRIVGDTLTTTKSLDKLTVKRLLYPTNFTYTSIADNILSSYLVWFSRELKENMITDGFITEDKVFIIFFYVENEATKVIRVWESWEIRIGINPTNSSDEIERDLNYVKSAIHTNIMHPLPHTISIRDCKRIFDCNQGHTWLYNNFILQGTKLPPDHVLYLDTNLENLGKTLFIVFEAILSHRCQWKLHFYQDGELKSIVRRGISESVPEYGISYPRICCEDLRKYIRSRADYCRSFIENVCPSRQLKTFYLSFYHLNLVNGTKTTRKICERWQIVCRIHPTNIFIPSNLSYLLSYIERATFPDSLQVSPTLEYEELYKYYFTTLASCTPPRFYIHG